MEKHAAIPEAYQSWGDLDRVFHVTRLYTVGNWILGYMAFVTGAGIMAALIFFLPENVAAMVLGACVGCGLALVGVLALIMARYWKDLHCLVLRDGAVWHHQGKIRGVRWDEIKLIYKQKTRLGMKTHDGRGMTWSIRFLTTPGILSHLVEEKVHTLQAATLRESFEKGEPLDFGPLQITHQGLLADGVTVPWSEIDNIKVGETRAGSYIAILKKGTPNPFWRGKTALIPNYYSFTKLLSYAMGWARKQPVSGVS